MLKRIKAKIVIFVDIRSHAAEGNLTCPIYNNTLSPMLTT